MYGDMVLRGSCCTDATDLITFGLVRASRTNDLVM